VTVSAGEIQEFVATFEERLAPAEKASSEAWWNLATTGTEEAQKELVRTGMAYNALFADRDEYEMVRGWYEDRESLESSILRRQVEILYKTFVGRQGDEETLRRIEELEAEANATTGVSSGTERPTRTSCVRSCASQTTRPCAARPGRPRRASGERSRASCESSPACATGSPKPRASRTTTPVRWTSRR
jgi:hypothetical protein